MKTSAVMVLAALAGGASVAVAGPTWTPDNTYGDSFVAAAAYDGGSYDYNDNFFNAFGIYAVSASIGGGSASNTLDWNANGASSVFSASASNGGSNEYYYGVTALNFVAGDGGDYDMNVAFDWQGSGQDGIQALFQLYDFDTSTFEQSFDNVASGPVSVSHTGTLVAGHRYQAYYYAYVYGNGDIVGTGSGSGDMTLSIVPLPTASALAGLGLLGLGVRRRRESL